MNWLAASIFLSSPLSTSASSVPLAKTIGNVSQPVHIFSALRRRQSLK